MRIVIVTLLALTSSTEAKEFGRVGISSYYSDERFKRAGPEGENNDYLSFAGRFYYRRDQMTKWDQDLQLDLRSLYDAYGKLDGEKQELNEESEYELKQLALTRDRERERGWSIGRFHSAGPSIETVDGLEYAQHVNGEWALGGLAGLSPTLSGEDHLIFDQRSQTAGAWAQWRPWAQDIGQGFFNQVGLNTQRFEGQSDSLKIEEASTLHWGSGAHYTYHLLTYQMIPRGYIAHWGLLYHWQQSSKWDMEYQLSTHEQERIFRSQERRFELPTARVSQARGEWGYRLSTHHRLSYFTEIEKRHADNGWANSHTLKWRAPELLSPHLSAQAEIGFENDYEKKDYFGQIQLEWYNRYLELYWQERLAEEHYDNKELLRPMTSEIGGTLLFLSDWAPTFSVLHQFNANVEIFQALLRLSYHFGEDRRPPGPNHAPRVAQ